ncbi:MAG: hypothetical protein IKP65_02920 [Alphaproteobacteria bacterium]|nr:hypothetical protein [Alphaproteobacteria bacterium]
MTKKKYDIISKLDEYQSGFYEWNKPFYLINKKDKRAKKFKNQKEKHGFSDDETWSLYTSTVLFFLPRIKRFKKIIEDLRMHPASLNEQEWIDILNKIVNSFELMFKEDINGKNITKEEQEQINEGLDLFGKYFQDLWW